jgi:DNA-binding GntR family transcriptional regulator
VTFSLNADVAERPSLRAQVERALSAAVVSGQLEPGQLLTVPTLAVEFKVSATPVREALLELARRGLVEPVRNKGFRVTEVSEQELESVAEIRMLLEPPSMRRLAPEFDPARADEMRELADRIKQGAEERDLKLYLEGDLDFHARLTSMLGNPLLTEMVNDLRARARLGNLQRMAESGHLAASAAEHHELIEALLQHDADLAEEIMRRHVGHTVGIWVGRAEE